MPVRDLLGDVFRLVRLRAAVYYQHEFTPPWAFRVPARPHAQFHVVLGGKAVLRTGADQKTTTRLAAGDVALFPTGAPHVIADAPDTPPRVGREVVAAIQRGESPFGIPNEGGTAARLLFGHFEFDRGFEHSLFTGLPELIHVRRAAARDPGGARAADALLSVLAEELGRGQPGAQTVVERLAEVALVQTLRAHFAGDGRSRAGTAPHFLCAVFHEGLARAVALTHERYAEPLGLAELAAAARMSRAAFAARFRAATGLSPVGYLARWRMLMARELLISTERSVAEVALAVGHRSQEGFSRAFKRAFGVSPLGCRRRPPQADAG